MRSRIYHLLYLLTVWKQKDQTRSDILIYYATKIMVSYIVFGLGSWIFYEIPNVTSTVNGANDCFCALGIIRQHVVQ
jgi:hypothetical protein